MGWDGKGREGMFKIRFNRIFDFSIFYISDFPSLRFLFFSFSALLHALTTHCTHPLYFLDFSIN